MNAHKLVHIFGSVTGILLLAKLLGFVRQMVTASAFGTSLETDLITLSQGFIGDLQYVLVQVLMTSFVSVYIYIQEKDTQESGRFAGDVIRVFLVLSGVIVTLILLFAPVLARIIAPSYNAQLSAKLAGYLRLFCPMLLLFVLMAVYQALLNANSRFLPGQMEGIHQSLAVIAVVLLFGHKIGVQALTVSFFLYMLWNTLFLRIASHRYQIVFRGNPFQNFAVWDLLRMSGPLFLGYAMIYVNQQVDKILASGLSAGTVTALGYAAVLSNLIATFIATFSSILFPYVTAKIAQQQHEQAACLICKSALLMTAAFLPISILTVLCAEDVVSVVFGRGAFSGDAVRNASYALMGYAFSFVPQVFQQLFSRFHYGYQDTRRPMINSTIGIVFNIMLSIALCPTWGVFGVAFASSVSSLICGVLNVLFARRHNSFFHTGMLLRPLILLVLDGAVCAFVAHWGITLWGGLPALVRFLLVTLTAGGIYAAVVTPLVIKILRQTITSRDVRKKDS